MSSRARTESEANEDDLSKLAIIDQPKSDEGLNSVLNQLMTHLEERTKHHLGYPYNLEFDSSELAPFLKYSINNLGDPFNASNYGVHCRSFELSVLNFFADLWEIERGAFWGYTTTCGTEGNLLGVLYGREKLPYGVLYCSKETHYSIPKAAAMYRIPIELVETDETGEMDYDDFEAKVRKHPGRPAIVAFNLGTTVKGAYDNVDEILKRLDDIGIPRSMTYLHCDGALNGLILPFLADDQEPKKASFKKRIDSISVSGHKMLGAPMPCGVVITRKEHMERWASDVEYLNSSDTTIMGSRNGQASLAMWVALQRKGLVGLKRDVEQCIENANFLAGLLREAGVKTTLNKYSTTVVFERPSHQLVIKWQLACTGDIAHVVVMPSTDKAKLKTFFKEYMEDRESAEQDPVKAWEK